MQHARSVGADMGAQDAPALDSIRGWLLVFCFALVPHLVESALILARSRPAASAAGFTATVTSVAGLRMATQAATCFGQGIGIYLILTKNRYAPAFFTLFLPFQAVLAFADPDPAATLVANAHALGFSTFTYGDMARQVAARAVLGLGFAALMVGYFLRSKRVRHVFGSNGLSVFRRLNEVPR